MQLTVSLAADDLAAMRFAISPLSETVTAVRLLQDVKTDPVNWPWLRWARAELAREPLALPRLWPLLLTGTEPRPEFLTPAPITRAPSISEELARMRATAPEEVRESLRGVFGDMNSWPDSARQLAQQPECSLEVIAAEITDAHDRVIAPHWDRIRAVLDADIAYRGGVLAAAGAQELFAGLHAGVRWQSGVLTLSLDLTGLAERQIPLGPDGGLVLVPSVLIWPKTTVKLRSSTQTTLRYPARGVAAVWEGGALPVPESVALRDLLGAPRARLLLALRSPATTTGLARSLGVSPAAVSQHITVLRRCRLVDRVRSGRAVLYKTSDLGLALLDVSAAPEVP